MDFTDLNLVCHKDPYPLPNIVRLADGASGYKTSNFMDTYPYNQIKNDPLDVPKTAFMSNNCNCYYEVIHFKLKN